MPGSAIDSNWLSAYAAAAQPFAAAFASLGAEARRLPDAHARVCDLAERWLPTHVDLPEADDADAE